MSLAPAWTDGAVPADDRGEIQLRSSAAARAILQVSAGRETVHAPLDLEAGRTQRLHVAVGSAERVTATLTIDGQLRSVVSSASLSLNRHSSALRSRRHCDGLEGFNAIGSNRTTCRTTRLPTRASTPWCSMRRHWPRWTSDSSGTHFPRRRMRAHRAHRPGPGRARRTRSGGRLRRAMLVSAATGEETAAGCRPRLPCLPRRKRHCPASANSPRPSSTRGNASSWSRRVPRRRRARRDVLVVRVGVVSLRRSRRWSPTACCSLRRRRRTCSSGRSRPTARVGNTRPGSESRPRCAGAHACQVLTQWAPSVRAPAASCVSCSTRARPGGIGRDRGAPVPADHACYSGSFPSCGRSRSMRARATRSASATPVRWHGPPVRWWAGASLRTTALGPGESATLRAHGSMARRMQRHVRRCRESRSKGTPRSGRSSSPVSWMLRSTRARAAGARFTPS